MRPIASPAILRRLAGKALVSPRRKELAEALGAHQFAIGTSAGTELLAHTVRALTEADPDLVVCALDATNAYCTASRRACLEELAATAPEVARCARLFSARASQYFFWDSGGRCHTLHATDGVDQGDPLAPLLFACGVAPCLRALETELRALAATRGLAPDRVHVFAFLDDVVVLAPPELAAETLPAAQRALEGFGLKLHPGKTHAWSPRAACPAGLEEQWCEEGITLVGAALGDPLPESGLPAQGDDRRVDLGSAGFTEARCNETAERAARFCERVADLPALASPHLPAAQAASLLLRSCGSSKITHLLRSTPPEKVHAAAGAFDTAVLEAYEKLANLDPLTDHQRTQCRLPLRLGGRGLRSQLRLAPAAWVGSWAQNLSEVKQRSGLDCLADLEACDLPLAVACKNALATLPGPQAGGDEDDTLPTWRELAHAPRRSAQRLLSRRLDKKLHADLLNDLDAKHRARLRSCGGPLGAGWQLASPALPAERLDDADFTATARSLLGQSHLAADGTCKNKRATGERAGQTCGEALCHQAHHAYRCALGGGPKKRSVAVERALERIHLDCGFQTAREVHVPAWDRFHWKCSSEACAQRGTAFAPPTGPCASCGAALASEREEAVLDLEVRGPDVPRLYLDVTVRHAVPGSGPRLAQAAAHDGAVNKEAEATKRSRYPDRQAPCRVVPFALETYGRLGRTALLHLRKLARAQAQRLDEGADGATSALLQRWGCRLSVALHRANSEALRSALGKEAGAHAAKLDLGADLAA